MAKVELTAEDQRNMTINDFEKAKASLQKLIDQGKVNDFQKKKYTEAIKKMGTTQKIVEGVYNKAKTEHEGLFNAGNDVVSLAYIGKTLKEHGETTKANEIMNQNIENIDLNGGWGAQIKAKAAADPQGFSNGVCHGLLGIAVAEFATQGITALFGSQMSIVGAAGVLLPKAATLAGNALQAIFGFSPLGGTLLVVAAAIKVAPLIMRAVKYFSNKSEVKKTVEQITNTTASSYENNDNFSYGSYQGYNNPSNSYQGYNSPNNGYGSGNNSSYSNSSPLNQNNNYQDNRVPSQNTYAPSSNDSYRGMEGGGNPADTSYYYADGASGTPLTNPNSKASVDKYNEHFDNANILKSNIESCEETLKDPNKRQELGFNEQSVDDLRKNYNEEIFNLTKCLGDPQIASQIKEDNNYKESLSERFKMQDFAFQDLNKRIESLNKQNFKDEKESKIVPANLK